MKIKEIVKLKNKNANYRLNNVLKKDKEINPEYIKEVLKSDIYYLMNNYFEVDFLDIDVDIKVGDDKKYFIQIKTKGDRLKFMKRICD